MHISASSKKTPTTVLLADDHSGYRQALKLFLEVDGTIRVVGEAKNGAAAVRLTSRLCPDVVLMDILMPVLNGLEACRQITTTNQTARVLILSAKADKEYIQKAKEYGAFGYLVKSKATRVLHKSIDAIKRGKNCFGKFRAPIVKTGCLVTRWNE